MFGIVVIEFFEFILVGLFKDEVLKCLIEVVEICLVELIVEVCGGIVELIKLLLDLDKGMIVNFEMEVVKFV